MNDPRDLVAEIEACPRTIRHGEGPPGRRAPNGQRFAAYPHSVWLVSDSKATLDGIEL